MSNRNQDRIKLTGWKDIADHLLVSEKTACEYARRYGLPVHQAGKRTHVWAWLDEIQRWERDQNLAVKN